MNKKQGVIGLVATVMIANAAFVDVRPVYAVENSNLAKGCTVRDVWDFLKEVPSDEKGKSKPEDKI